MYYDWESLTPEEEETIARGIKDRKAYGGPYHMLIFPTDRCNFKCHFCYGIDYKTELPWPRLKAILEESIEMGNKGISMSGGGEPMLYRHFDELLSLMAERSLRFYSLTTNGSMLNRESAERLIQLGLRYILVSLDETTPQTHHEICKTSPRMFNSVLQGITDFVEAKKQYNSDCELVVQIFVHRKNYRQLLEMIDTTLSLQPDNVLVNTLNGMPKETRLTETEREELKEILVEAIDRWGEKLQFRLIAEGLQEFVTIEQGKRAPEAHRRLDICTTSHRVEYCYVGWHAPMINAYGDVFPCCIMASRGRARLGNILKQSLHDVWYGEDMQAFRKEMSHVMHTRAQKELQPRNPRFILPVCKERADCHINFYLASPQFYQQMDEWFEPRRIKYIRLYKMKSAIKSHLRENPLARKTYSLAQSGVQKLFKSTS